MQGVPLSIEEQLEALIRSIAKLREQYPDPRLTEVEVLLAGSLVRFREYLGRILP